MPNHAQEGSCSQCLRQAGDMNKIRWTEGEITVQTSNKRQTGDAERNQETNSKDGES